MFTFVFIGMINFKLCVPFFFLVTCAKRTSLECKCKIKLNKKIIQPKLA